ncbi:uncharacterized protein EI90DRAFT_3018790 [Cantharellus anzutake]|uniref:uncharacterized protein n=1 Tax=Cantharellus anzutake TaxID=1750568 RepID=UPI001905FB54|nr:uncharacterized protein EI90DRAFT_3018790 [Cantharellus anzutake]KAF8326059.1 hypothetical protein EI90DRAFT_3018790 [Cantharellus anzutake]
MAIALSIVPPKGFNAAGRFWPFSGHLGLTPVSVSGIVRTKLDPDAPSSSTTGGSAMTIALKCYESRLGRVGVIRTNVLYEQQVVLWSAAAVTAGNTVGSIASTPIAHTSLASISNSASGSMPSPISNSTAAGASTAHTEMIPQGDFPFNIIIPPNSSSSTGFSSCHLQSYRVFWRLEASE